MKLSLTAIFTFIVLASAQFVNAVNVTLTHAGSLSANISNPETETSLSIKGVIDASDLFFIADNMPALKSLDLSGAEITASEIESSGRTVAYEAGLIPKHIFAASSIENLTLPKSSEITIGEMAFAGAALKSLTLEPNIKSVGLGAFSSCASLIDVNIYCNNALDSHIFAACNSLKTVRLEKVDIIPASLFSGCSSLSAVEGSKSVKKIGDSAFASCSSLGNFDFGESLSSIGESAFSATALTNLDLSACKNLVEIGNWAFAYCAILKKVELPSSIDRLGEGVFFDCTSLASLSLPENATTIDRYALKGLASISEISFPASLDSIGDLAMSGMDNLSVIYAQALKTVPALGDDVWDTLDKSEVSLHVSTELSPEFLTTPQWQDFQIVNVPTGMVNEAIADNSKIQASLIGSQLIVRSSGSNIRTLRIYDLDGRALYNLTTDTDEVRVELNHLIRLFVVEVTTDTKLRAALKIAR